MGSASLRPSRNADSQHIERNPSKDRMPESVGDGRDATLLRFVMSQAEPIYDLDAWTSFPPQSATRKLNRILNKLAGESYDLSHEIHARCEASNDKRVSAIPSRVLGGKSINRNEVTVRENDACCAFLYVAPWVALGSLAIDCRSGHNEHLTPKIKTEAFKAASSNLPHIPTSTVSMCQC
ncbi:hypothetical protein ACRALDRAFT_207908 [Sodiomyces alcalophilus JCM 7366]|uniref:uncharacterized protein n=1 Tax=Sodiomyces alcalophilus JCM 7366 TaxID=591952 RepID=UPI0039B54AD7